MDIAGAIVGCGEACAVNHRFCSVAAIVLLLTPLHAQQPADRLTQWLEAIKAHEPGHPGKVALDVATWPGAEIEAVVVEAKRYARDLEKARPGAGNDVLLRGAALHADIASLNPTDFERRSANQSSIFIVSDGREQGTRYVSIHWGLGRSLLDGIAPEPGSHPGVLRWYQDTSKELLRLRSLSEAAVNLPRARRIFPTDPTLLFLSGVLHERFSSASLQAAADSVLAAKRGATSVGSAKAELERAERFFRGALAVEPGNLEARVRHGRVLGELGRHEQSAEVLRGAIQAGVAGEFLYMAEMCLGKQEEAMEHSAEARAHFERAASLYPRAQSPRLALSQLSRRVGDRSGAQRELRILAELPEDERQREDPWWNYYDVR